MSSFDLLVIEAQVKILAKYLNYEFIRTDIARKAGISLYYDADKEVFTIQRGYKLDKGGFVMQETPTAFGGNKEHRNALKRMYNDLLNKAHNKALSKLVSQELAMYDIVLDIQAVEE